MDIPRETDLSNLNIARQILDAHLAQEQCPNIETFSNIKVLVYQAAERFPVIMARNYDCDRLTWSEYNNKAVIRQEQQARARKQAQERARGNLNSRRKKPDKPKNERIKRLLGRGAGMIFSESTEYRNWSNRSAYSPIHFSFKEKLWLCLSPLCE